MKLCLIGCLVSVLAALVWSEHARGAKLPLAGTQAAAAQLPQDAVVRLGSHQFVHSGRIRDLTFVPDGSALLAVSENGACLWNLANATPRHSFAGAWMRGALSSDGRTIVLAENGPLIQVYDAITGAATAQMSAAKERTLALALSADGRLAASTDGGDVLIWEISRPSIVRRVKLHGSMIDALQFSPDGHRLVYADVPGGKAQILDLAGRTAPVTLAGKRGFLPWFVFSPDGGRVVGACDVQEANVVKCFLRCWDGATGRTIYDVPGSFEAGAMSPDGRWVAAFEVEHVVMFDAVTGMEVRRLPFQHQHIWALAFSPDGKTLATGQDQRVRLWRTDTLEEVFPGVGHSEPVQAVAFSPDGGAIATGGLDGRIIEWSWPGAREKRRLDGVGSSWGVQHLTFSPDGKCLAATAWVNGSDPFYLLDSQNLQLLESFGKEDPSEGPLTFLADTNDIDKLRGQPVWRLRAGETILAQPATNVCAVCSPDGRFQATAKNGGVVLLEILTGKAIHRFEAANADVKALAFSPDGTVLVTSDYDDALIWDLTGRWKNGRLERAGLTRAELATLWDTLGSDDGWAAGHAAWTLAAGGSASVAFLAKHLRPAVADPGRIAALRTQLTNAVFDKRQEAARQLRDMGAELRPNEMEALRRPNPVVDDIGRSVGFLPPPALLPLPDRLRSSRAIMALEHCFATEATPLLDKLADGAPSAPQTIEAKAALAWRLARHPDR